MQGGQLEDEPRDHARDAEQSDRPAGQAEHQPDVEARRRAGPGPMRWHTEDAAVQQHAAAASKIALSIGLPLPAAARPMPSPGPAAWLSQAHRVITAGACAARDERQELMARS
jgi:hypothetical protein